MKHLKPDELVDLFISDCLLPSTTKKLRAAVTFKVFEAFCAQLNIGTPCSIVHYGRCMSRRFQRANINGAAHYFCELKKGIIEEE